MINSELSEISYVIQAGVTTYPIGFEYHFNENNSPQLLVKIGESVAIINVDFQLSADESEIILIPTEEEAKAQTSPNDTRWMDRIVSKELLITRDIPFVQTSDYTVGRISPEQIEYDFDRTVMRDQEILHKLNDFTVDVALAESLANAAVETANEAATAANQATATANTALETANNAIVTANDAKAVATQASQDAVDAIADSANAVNKAEAADMTATTAMEIAAEAVTVAQGAETAVANKQDKLTAGTNVSIVGTTINVDGYSKAQVDNKVRIIEADVDANADAIQKTRADFISADSDIHTILNNHAGELTTLHNDVDAVGDQISGIEEKIPGTASASNPLVTKQQLLDEEMDIREDLNSGLSELQTQVTAQAAEIAKKQDELTAGENITIVDGVISSTGGVSGDYLPLSGGTMTGPIRWGRFTALSGYDGGITINPSVSTTYSFSDSVFQSNASTTRQLGTADYPWTKAYLSSISSGTETITVPEKSGTLALLEDLGGATGGDYLPLSGGTIDGDLNITGEIRFDDVIRFNSGGVNEIGILFNGSNTNIQFFGKTQTSEFEGIVVHGDKPQLGHSAVPWDTTHTKKISNGSDLIVPTEGGTLARVEDITAIGGEGTTGQVLTKTDDGFAWQDSAGGGASGDFLPLSGGTMTGAINYADEFETISQKDILTYTITNPNSFIDKTLSFSWKLMQDQTLAFVPSKPNTGGFKIGRTALTPRYDGGYELGSPTYRIGTVCAKWLSGTKGYGVGNLITIPDTTGTMVVATPPTDNGTYVLKATVVDGTVTTEWVLES